jgi:cytidyltransferase-like protein
MEKYKGIVFIGRVQPLHNSHIELLTHALEISEKLLIIIGSSFAARTVKNPFTFEERKAMILASLSEYEDRIVVEPQRDYFYDEAQWSMEVTQKIKKHFNLTDTIGLVGMYKDHSSYYLNNFPFLEFIPFQPKFAPSGATEVREALFEDPYNTGPKTDLQRIIKRQLHNPDKDVVPLLRIIQRRLRDFKVQDKLQVDLQVVLKTVDRKRLLPLEEILATLINRWHSLGEETKIQIAEQFLGKDLAKSFGSLLDVLVNAAHKWEDKHTRTAAWFSLVPNGTRRFIQDNFLKSAEFARLQKEFEHVKQYKQQWSKSPYPPSFITSDFILKCCGNVLLVRRKLGLGKGLLALPGGFVRHHETMRQAAVRELREETCLNISALELDSVIKSSKIFDYPTRSLRGRTVTNAFFGELDSADVLPQVQGSDDAAEAEWVPIYDIYQKSEQFFEDHFHIIHYFLTQEGK